MANLGINMGAVQPNVGFSAMDKGKYTVIMYKSDFKPTGGGTGKALETHYRINGGPNNGREIMLSFTWENATAKAVEIGQGQFRAICDAVNVIPQDSQQLHNIPFLLEVDVTPDGKYNNFVSAFPLQQQAPPQAQPVYQQPVQQAPQGVLLGYDAQGQPIFGQPPVQQQPAPQQQYVAPAGQANPNDPMAAYQQMAQPAQQPQPQVHQAPQGAVEEPDWIKNQRLAAAGQAPMGNGQ